MNLKSIFIVHLFQKYWLNKQKSKFSWKLPLAIPQYICACLNLKTPYIHLLWFNIYITCLLDHAFSTRFKVTKGRNHASYFIHLPKAENRFFTVNKNFHKGLILNQYINTRKVKKRLRINITSKVHTMDMTYQWC